MNALNPNEDGSNTNANTYASPLIVNYGKKYLTFMIMADMLEGASEDFLKKMYSKSLYKEIESRREKVTEARRAALRSALKQAKIKYGFSSIVASREAAGNNNGEQLPYPLARFPIMIKRFQREMARNEKIRTMLRVPSQKDFMQLEDADFVDIVHVIMNAKTDISTDDHDVIEVRMLLIDYMIKNINEALPLFKEQFMQFLSNGSVIVLREMIPSEERLERIQKHFSDLKLALTIEDTSGIAAIVQNSLGNAQLGLMIDELMRDGPGYDNDQLSSQNLDAELQQANERSWNAESDESADSSKQTAPGESPIFNTTNHMLALFFRDTIAKESIAFARERWKTEKELFMMKGLTDDEISEGYAKIDEQYRNRIEQIFLRRSRFMQDSEALKEISAEELTELMKEKMSPRYVVTSALQTGKKAAISGIKTAKIAAKKITNMARSFTDVLMSVQKMIDDIEEKIATSVSYEAGIIQLFGDEGGYVSIETGLDKNKHDPEIENIVRNMKRFKDTFMPVYTRDDRAEQEKKLDDNIWLLENRQYHDQKKVEDLLKNSLQLQLNLMKNLSINHSHTSSSDANLISTYVSWAISDVTKAKEFADTKPFSLDKLLSFATFKSETNYIWLFLGLSVGLSSGILAGLGMLASLPGGIVGSIILTVVAAFGGFVGYLFSGINPSSDSMKWLLQKLSSYSLTFVFQITIAFMLAPSLGIWAAAYVAFEYVVKMVVMDFIISAIGVVASSFSSALESDSMFAKPLKPLKFIIDFIVKIVNFDFGISSFGEKTGARAYMIKNHPTLTRIFDFITSGFRRVTTRSEFIRTAFVWISFAVMSKYYPQLAPVEVHKTSIILPIMNLLQFAKDKPANANKIEQTIGIMGWFGLVGPINDIMTFQFNGYYDQATPLNWWQNVVTGLVYYFAFKSVELELLPSLSILDKLTAPFMKVVAPHKIFDMEQANKEWAEKKMNSDSCISYRLSDGRNYKDVNQCDMTSRDKGGCYKTIDGEKFLKETEECEIFGENFLKGDVPLTLDNNMTIDMEKLDTEATAFLQSQIKSALNSKRDGLKMFMEQFGLDENTVDKKIVELSMKLSRNIDFQKQLDVILSSNPAELGNVLTPEFINEVSGSTLNTVFSESVKSGQKVFGAYLNKKINPVLVDTCMKNPEILKNISTQNMSEGTGGIKIIKSTLGAVFKNKGDNKSLNEMSAKYVAEMAKAGTSNEEISQLRTLLEKIRPDKTVSETTQEWFLSFLAKKENESDAMYLVRMESYMAGARYWAPVVKTMTSAAFAVVSVIGGMFISGYKFLSWGLGWNKTEKKDKKGTNMNPMKGRGLMMDSRPRHGPTSIRSFIGTPISRDRPSTLFPSGANIAAIISEVKANEQKQFLATRVEMELTEYGETLDADEYDNAVFFMQNFTHLPFMRAKLRQIIRTTNQGFKFTVGESYIREYADSMFNSLIDAPLMTENVLDQMIISARKLDTLPAVPIVQFQQKDVPAICAQINTLIKDTNMGSILLQCTPHNVQSFVDIFTMFMTISKGKTSASVSADVEMSLY